TITSSLNPSLDGQAVTFTATVTALPPATGVPTGTISFLDGTTVLALVTLANGQASFTTSSLAVGIHTITAQYSGDSTFVPTTASLVQVVRGFTETVLVSSRNPSVVGKRVTFTATVSATDSNLIPTGIVSFFDGATFLGNASLDASGN